MKTVEFKVGSHSYQVMELDKKIKMLTDHLKRYKKDNVTKLALFKLVSKKKRFMKYLKNNNPEHHQWLVDNLNRKNKS